MLKVERSSSSIVARRRQVVISWSRLLWYAVLFLLCCSLLDSFSSSSAPFTRRFRFSQQHGHGHDTLQLVSTWPNPNPVMEAISEFSTTTPPPQPLHAVIFPDQVSIFLNYPHSLTADDIDCLYHHHHPNYSSPVQQLLLRPLHLDNDDTQQIIRCPLPPHDGFSDVKLSFKKTPTINSVQGGPTTTITTYRWNWLAYSALIDETDNTTIVFIKGFNLRPGRLSDPTKFRCVYGYDDLNPTTTTTTTSSRRVYHRSEALSVGQEIVRCKTPLSILLHLKRPSNPIIKVSVRLMGRATLPSIAQPKPIPPLNNTSSNNNNKNKRHVMCVCTMLRNQAKFLHEWITYHSHIGVQRWYIYDNNSDDDIDSVINSLKSHNITKHSWPWIKSQEAGFAHCALHARNDCQWIGFIDVDEFFHFPNTTTTTTPTPSHLHTILQNHSPSPPNPTNKTKKPIIGEIRTFCYNFGPSGHTHQPKTGVTTSYTCRVAVHERHKSIIRPEALSSALINSVHHFQLKDGYESVTLDRPVMVINHYKYQVWSVFKEKFYRRVATYVADWKDEENFGSKDRVPGVGTKEIEPEDWRFRFCEVRDTELKDVVVGVFAHKVTKLLPWETNSNK